MIDERDETHPKVSFRMPADLHKQVKHYCVENRTSMTALFIQIAQAVVDERVVVSVRNTQPWEQSK